MQGQPQLAAPPLQRTAAQLPLQLPSSLAQQRPPLYAGGASYVPPVQMPAGGGASYVPPIQPPPGGLPSYVPPSMPQHHGGSAGPLTGTAASLAPGVPAMPPQVTGVCAASPATVAGAVANASALPGGSYTPPPQAAHAGDPRRFSSFLPPPQPRYPVPLPHASASLVPPPIPGHTGFAAGALGQAGPLPALPRQATGASFLGPSADCGAVAGLPPRLPPGNCGAPGGAGGVCGGSTTSACLGATHGACGMDPAPTASAVSRPFLNGRPQHTAAAMLEHHFTLPGNDDCADCGCPRPDWASVNQGVLLCIDCAGVHRSLGAHVSKVKSLRLDSWKPEEASQLLSKGGNAEVNRRLAYVARRPPPGASRADLAQYIALKYRALTTGSFAPVAAPNGHGHSAQDSGGQLSAQGHSCHQGLVIVEVQSVELYEDRVTELRMLGPLFLSLSVVLSLGPATAQRTSVRRGASSAEWRPPERRELLWDAQERWLWCRVYDGGELTGAGQLAAEGRVDLAGLAAEGGANPGASAEMGIELYQPLDEDEGDDDLNSEIGGSMASSPRRPRWGSSISAVPPGAPGEDFPTGPSCGILQLQLTIIDMSGMLKQQRPSVVAVPAHNAAAAAAASPPMRQPRFSYVGPGPPAPPGGSISATVAAGFPAGAAAACGCAAPPRPLVGGYVA